jgi:hypothetical protein
MLEITGAVTSILGFLLGLAAGIPIGKNIGIRQRQHQMTKNYNYNSRIESKQFQFQSMK